MGRAIVGSATAGAATSAQADFSLRASGIAVTTVAVALVFDTTVIAGTVAIITASHLNTALVLADRLFRTIQIATTTYLAAAGIADFALAAIAVHITFLYTGIVQAGLITQTVGIGSAFHGHAASSAAYLLIAAVRKGTAACSAFAGQADIF